MLRFTLEKKYPVFAEQLQLNGVGMAYKTVDDTGREQLISDEYFIPADAMLVADRELRFSETPESREGGNLLWGGAKREDNMPKLKAVPEEEGPREGSQEKDPPSSSRD